MFYNGFKFWAMAAGYASYVVLWVVWSVLGSNLVQPINDLQGLGI